MCNKIKEVDIIRNKRYSMLGFKRGSQKRNNVS
jgi:hypothetical protein